MVSKAVYFKSVTELSSLSSTITNDLISDSTSVPKLLGHQVSLMEIFTREVKKLDKLGYCDYELTLVAFDVSVALCSFCEKLKTKETEGFIQDIRKTLANKSANYKIIKGFIEAQGNEDSFLEENGSVDPLLARFNNLKVPPPAENNQKDSSEMAYTIDRFKYNEFITPIELHKLIYLDDNPAKVLLIDFRTRKEYNYNHIKHKDLVNIEPEWISTLHNGKRDILDLDLETRLEMLLPTEQYKMFLRRFTYDLVVIYNLRYGPSDSQADKFVSLKNLLISGDHGRIAVRSPFNALIDVITYKNKYLSSKLKRHPCILSGGVKAWFDIFGDNSIAKSNSTLTRPEASLSRGGSDSAVSSRNNSYGNKAAYENFERSASPYLKNFGEYLSTAKSGGNTPVSNSFLPPLSNSSMAHHASNLPASMSCSRDAYSTSSVTRPDSDKLSTSPPQQQKPKIPSSPQIRFSLSSSQKPSGSPNKVKSTTTNESTTKNTSPVKFLQQYTTGLTNLGNSCYMNCIIQCLGATPQLTRFFFPDISNSSFPSSSSLQSYRQHINVNNKLGSKGILTTNFVNLLVNMFSNVGKYFTPTSFKNVVGSLSPNKQFATFDQQDCIEFLNFLLDGLHEDLNQMIIDNPEEKKSILELTPEQESTREVLPVRLASTIEWERYLKLNFSIIVDYFQGQYLSQLRCLECGLTSTTYNAFLILSLPIPEKLGSTKDVLLRDCLQEFVTTELLDEDNKWHCPRCKKFTKLTKKITITRLPQVLIIHFKRFKINKNGYFNKLDTFIKYQVNDVLDLTSYWPGVGTSVDDSFNGTEKIPKEREQQILSTLPMRNQQPPFRYKLYAVANHFGNLTTGHYTSYVYKQGDEKKTRGWCYFDDAKVTQNCKENQVLNRNAYCLFYQRI